MQMAKLEPTGLGVKEKGKSTRRPGVQPYIMLVLMEAEAGGSAAQAQRASFTSLVKTRLKIENQENELEMELSAKILGSVPSTPIPPHKKKRK